MKSELKDKMKKQIYYDNNGKEILSDKLYNCPFCNSIPSVFFIGNDRTKKRQVRIKCLNPFCGATVSKAGVRNTTEQVLLSVIEIWNKREGGL